MSGARDKRLLLGWLALVAPLPLPFNEALGWPFLFVYALLVVYFLQRAERGVESWLPNWVLNLLGVAYLPFFWVDLQKAVFRSSFVTALLHLIMFLVVVKLYSLRHTRDAWQVVIAVFFVFLGAMATSSHLAIAGYLLLFLVVGLYTLERFAELHLAARFHGGVAAPRRRGGVLAAAALAAVVVAIPLFALAPRLREPFILGRGTGTGGLIRSTGFSDSVDLNLTSSIRSRRDVALRIEFRGRRPAAEELRFKGATFDLYRDRSWYRAPGRGRRLRVGKGERFELAPRPPVGGATVSLRPLRSFGLVLPVETAAVRFPFPFLSELGLDAGGAVQLPVMPTDLLTYDVELAATPVIPAAPDPTSALDRGGVTRRIAELAAAVAGEGPGEERVDRIERYLLSSFTYTTDFVGRGGDDPLEDFLFVYRSGHCEYFASAMVLMARSVGVPARLATGFLGAEYNPLEGGYVVRQQNAHAWVEAYTPERGWSIYDPTPPDGRPAVAEQSLALLAGQLWDYLLFRWDRYVLTYGAEDQAGLLRRLRQGVAGWWRRLTERLAAAAPAPPRTAVEPPPEEDLPAPAPPPPSPLPTVALAALAVLAALAIGLLWSRLPPPDASVAYRRLRRRLARAGLEVHGALAPLALVRRTSASFPAAGGPARRLVALYLRESFGGETLDRGERRRLAEALAGVAAALRGRRWKLGGRRRGGSAAGG